MEIERLKRRFEIAVGNFGRSCLGMKANEKAFQAWYAASVIQEFGMARVYRELHLWKAELFELAGNHPLYAGLRKGNELFPDLSVSWQPDVDARHSSTRSRNLRPAGPMLREFGILSELKVTGSTGSATPYREVRRDIAKLAVFAAAHRAAAIADDGLDAPLAAYMVVLDNFTDKGGEARPAYRRARIESFLSDVVAEWPVDVLRPTVMVIGPGEDSTAIVDTYRELQPQRVSSPA